MSVGLLGSGHAACMDELTLVVDGLPPVKNEAKSLLSAGHPHAYRVTALLQAAAQELERNTWLVKASDSLGMEVVLTSPVPPASDATNYLGGVGDVLEEKSRHGGLPHLGLLATTALYANDRQIHEVHYRWEAGTSTGYIVRLWIRSPP